MLPLGFLVFNWPKIITNLIIVQIITIFVMRIVLAIRLNSRILDVLLQPLSMIYIILICFNSILQTKFGKGVCWKGRSYDIHNGEELKLINEKHT